MARERRGFIVDQVWADITYTDQTGHQQNISKPATAHTSGESKHNLTDTEKQKRKIEHAKRIIHDTIAELKRSGATHCKGSVSTRIIARVGHTDDQGKRRDIIRVATSRTDAREKIKEILDDLEERNGKTIDAARMTFADLAKHFETHYLKEAEYIEVGKTETVLFCSDVPTTPAAEFVPKAGRLGDPIFFLRRFFEVTTTNRRTFL